MFGALVTSFDRPPRYAQVPDPVSRAEDEAVVQVLAAGLHPRVRSQADGSHYTSSGELPLVPGIDAVVRDSAGVLRYAVLGDGNLGTMADSTVIDLRRSVVLPSDVEPVQLAAAMNPAMSSWVALRRRIEFSPGQRVMILGATGNAGRMAVQVSKRLGASHVAAVGRKPDRLAELSALGADDVLTFRDVPRAADVDVVLDYVWGEPSSHALVDLLSARVDRSKQLTWLQIGSVAGPHAAVRSDTLRSARLQIVGSGIGSVPGREFVEELPHLVAAVTSGAFDVHARAVPLSDVESAWTAASETNDRIVFIP